MGGARNGSPRELQKSSSMATVSSGSGSGAFAEFGVYCQDTCSICLEKYHVTNPAMTYICGHAFHLQCAESWRERQRTCPLCWAPLQEAELYTGEPIPEKEAEVLLPPPQPAPQRDPSTPTHSTASTVSLFEEDEEDTHVMMPTTKWDLPDPICRLLSRCCPGLFSRTGTTDEA
eukprot:TRINITY_DN9013_c0_g1_i2.p1 TRINITY_DN9013_c0_g1~~TRINITY_DN9013_c0_g1_i2.p1  ORF type:complete len:190 (+),score=33.07 TRINITY_DN9013_c0_g1_i2:51-572(+)